MRAIRLDTCYRWLWTRFGFARRAHLRQQIPGLGAAEFTLLGSGARLLGWPANGGFRDAYFIAASDRAALADPVSGQSWPPPAVIAVC